MLYCGNVLVVAAATLIPRKQVEILFVVGKRFWQNGTFLKCQYTIIGKEDGTAGCESLVTTKPEENNSLSEKIPQIQLWPTLTRCPLPRKLHSQPGQKYWFDRRQNREKLDICLLTFFHLWTGVNDVASNYEWKILNEARTCWCGLALLLDNLSELERAGQGVFWDRDNVCCLTRQLSGRGTCFSCDWGIWSFTKQDLNRGRGASENSRQTFLKRSASED